MAKCAICGNEVHSGLVVDPGCLENIQAEVKMLSEVLQTYLDKIERVELVEVVRCKDCKWYDEMKCRCKSSFGLNGNVFSYNYCSNGERSVE